MDNRRNLRCGCAGPETREVNLTVQRFGADSQLQARKDVIMLCSLEVQLAPEGGYLLRVSGNTAVGRSGTGGRDAKHYSTAEALLTELEAFGLDQDVVRAAARALSNPDSRRRFVKFAEKVQIPFELLERADIGLFD